MSHLVSFLFYFILFYLVYLERFAVTAISNESGLSEASGGQEGDISSFLRSSSR